MEILSTLKKGNFIFYDHKNYHRDSKVKKGKHMYIVLHSYRHPYETYLIAPVTSSEGPLPSHVVELKKEDYPECLDHDSYIDLSFITVADKKRFEPCKVKNDMGIRDIIPSELPELKKEDMTRVDLKLILVLEMGVTVNAITDIMLDKKLSELNKSISNHIDVIDDYIENNDYLSKQKLKEEFHKLKSNLVLKNKVHT